MPVGDVNVEKDESECLDEEQEVRDMCTEDKCIEDKQEMEVVVDGTLDKQKGSNKHLEKNIMPTEFKVGGNAEDEDLEGEEYAVEDTKTAKKEAMENLTSLLPEKAEDGMIEVNMHV